MLVTTESLYQRKVAAIRAATPAALEHILLVGETDSPTAIAGTHDLTAPDGSRPPASPFRPPIRKTWRCSTSPAARPASPRARCTCIEAVVAHHMTGKFALDFHPDDVFWCTADPGWVTGTSYGIIAPLTHGLTSIVDEADFDAERWYRILQTSR